ncbi:AraC family transcriptional regulator [Sphingobacterium sp. Mn56C]|uniref:AraC family transcriptional regulator n=1 Tax=Sphingobacterium sp. Mn56C TaxID=3395261 RepID=UPI003BD665D6
MQSLQRLTLALLTTSGILPKTTKRLDGIMFFNWDNGVELFSLIPTQVQFYVVILGKSGRCRINVGGHKFVIKPNTVSIIPDMCWVAAHSPEPDFQAKVLLFESSFLKMAWTKASVLDDLLFINPNYPPVFPLLRSKYRDFMYKFDKISQEIEDNSAFGIDMIRLYLLQMLYDYNRICELCLLNSETRINRKFQVMHQFRQLVEQQFRIHKTVAAYADQLFISPKYLSECVVEQLGYPALKFIHNRIMQEAEYLLKYTHKSIKEIATELNFDTPTHFSRFFAQHNGVRPYTYRTLP